MRRPRRSEDFREFSRVKRFSESEVRFLETKGTDIALIFPNTYRVAASSLSFSLVRDIFWENGLGVERFFYEPSFKKFYSLENLRPLDEFRIWAFIVQFEPDVLNLLKILEIKSVPVKRDERGENHPKILIGGPITYFNPEIFKPIADYIYCGDLETHAKELVLFLKGLVPAEEIPSLMVPQLKENCKVAKFDINLRPPVGTILSPEGEFKEKLLIEIGRGCIRRCSFCMIGHLQKPARFLRIETLKRVLEKIPEDVPLGLISATVTDYPWLEDLLKLLEGRHFSVSSMRMDGLTLDLLKLLKKSGQKTFTVAPEAGSQKIRDILKKDISEEHVESSLKIGRKAGFDRIKMYFIYGVPGEDENDLRAIADLCEMAKKMGYKVKASLNPLIPKPGTAIKGKRMEDVKALREKEKFLKNLLKSIGVSFEFESIKNAYLQYKIANMTEKEITAYLEVAEKFSPSELLKSLAAY